MANFSLEPVLTMEITLDVPSRVGLLSSGAALTCVPLTGGHLKSIKGGILSDLVDAECINGLDASHADPSQKITRLAINSLWRNKDQSMISLTYSGIIHITEETVRIFMGDKDAKSTDFGNIFMTMKFETGDEKIKALEENVFVASGRLIVAPEQQLKAEYHISKLAN